MSYDDQSRHREVGFSGPWHRRDRQRGNDGQRLVLCRIRQEVVSDLYNRMLLAQEDFRAVYRRRADAVNRAARLRYEAGDFAPDGSILLEATDLEQLRQRLGTL